MIGLEGNLPLDCEPEVIERILGIHFASPAMLGLK